MLGLFSLYFSPHIHTIAMQKELVIVQPIEFALGSIVYLVTDIDSLPRMLTGVTIRPGGNVLYELTSVSLTSYHIAAELTEEKPIW